MKSMMAGIAVLVLAVGVAGCAASGEVARKGPPAPWVESYATVRTLYVSPDGTGSGETAQAPMSLKDAVEKAQPGDSYWLGAGTYKVGSLNLKANGTKDKPIVFRATPGQRVTIDGHVDMLGAYTWLWGIEFIDPDLLKSGQNLATHSVKSDAVGAHIINNIMHNSGGGIGGWDRGPDQVYYGNIIYGVGGDVNPPQQRTNYPTYTQNNYDTAGYKYWVQNMFIDGRPFGGKYNFHGYTEGGFVSGFNVRGNVFWNGQFLIGGGNQPHHHNVVVDNCFYNAPTVNLGWGRPNQVEFVDNYLGRCVLQVSALWGVSDVGPTKPLPNVFTGNTIANAPNNFVELRTATVVEKPKPAVGWNPVWGKAAIDPQDVFDGNTYAGGFIASLEAKGRKSDKLDLAGWQRETATAGKEFDKDSKIVPAPAEAKVFVFANEYELGRGHVVIYNWSKADRVTVDLSPILAKGAPFTVHAAKLSFDAPLVSGTYGKPVSIPMKGEEFGAFLVRTVVK